MGNRTFFKKIIKLLFIVAVILPGTLFCKVVTPSRALETANLFFYGNAATKAGSGLSMVWSSSDLYPATRGASDEPAFYVFSGNGNRGFVIVAGDDIISPILGYSFSSKPSASNDLPDGLRQWLGEITEHITLCRQNGATQSVAVKKEWESVAAGNIQHMWTRTRAGEGGKILETAQWGQRDPFNKECPLDGGKRTASGCVATAVSTIMYYHKWPDAGTGRTAQYKTETKKITVASRDLSKPYNWENMLPKYKGVSYTTTQEDAVARLVADVGATFEADYRSDGTSASTSVNQLFKYFKYDSGMTILARKDYFAEQFDNMLKKEIDAKRPILYAGASDEGGGHSFIVDGYDNTGNFHINWGWEGSSNGYFAITKHDYKNKQRAFIHIMPATGKNTEPEYWITLYNKGMVSEDTNFEDIRPGDYFMVKLLLNNRTAIDFNGYIRMAVVNKTGKIKEWVMDKRSAELSGRLTEGGKSTINPIVNCKLESEPQIGDKLAVFYSTDGENWSQVHPDPIDWVNDITWEIPIADALTIGESTSAKYNHNKRQFTFTYKKGVVATLLLDGTPVTEGVMADSTKVTIDASNLEGKKLILRLEKKKELEEIELSIEPAKK
jgi:hypothetical protein